MRIYDNRPPEGRKPSSGEAEELLGGMTAADGVSYLDIFRESQDGEAGDERPEGR